MKWFKNLKLYFRDIENFYLFNKDITKELNNPNSILNKYGVKRNWLRNVLYFQVNISNEFDYVNAGITPEMRAEQVFKNTEPLVSKLVDMEELNWGEYLSVDIQTLTDENGFPSLTYGVVYYFYPVYLTIRRTVNYLLFLTGLGVAGGLTYTYWDIIKQNILSLF